MRDCAQADRLTESSPRFWYIARAVREFVEHEGHGHLPLDGRVSAVAVLEGGRVSARAHTTPQIPDMTSTTEHFIALQVRATLFFPFARTGCIVCSCGVIVPAAACC
jgi:hypothetical protein